MGTNAIDHNEPIDRFTVIKMIHTGKYTSVYLVMDRLTNTERILKLLHIDKYTGDSVQRMMCEIDYQSKVVHPNIISIIECFREGDTVGVLMEYASKQDFFGFLRSCEQDWPNDSTDTIMKILYQVCLALKAMHDQGFIHRDVKPENILLDSNLNGKLCDFGWCCEVRDEVYTLEKAGTVAFMSPEALQGKRQGTPTDVWSFGVLLYEVCHSKEPFQGSSKEARLKSILNTQPVFDSIFSKDLADIFYGCTKLDPTDRLTMEDVLNSPAFRDLKLKSYPIPQLGSSENITRDTIYSPLLQSTSIRPINNQSLRTLCHQRIGTKLQTSSKKQIPLCKQPNDSPEFKPSKRPLGLIFSAYSPVSIFSPQKTLSNSFIKKRSESSFSQWNNDKGLIHESPQTLGCPKVQKISLSSGSLYAVYSPKNEPVLTSCETPVSQPSQTNMYYNQNSNHYQLNQIEIYGDGLLNSIDTKTNQRGLHCEKRSSPHIYKSKVECVVSDEGDKKKGNGVLEVKNLNKSMVKYIQSNQLEIDQIDFVQPDRELIAQKGGIKSFKRKPLFNAITESNKLFKKFKNPSFSSQQQLNLKKNTPRVVEITAESKEIIKNQTSLGMEGIKLKSNKFSQKKSYCRIDENQKSHYKILTARKKESTKDLSFGFGKD